MPFRTYLWLTLATGQLVVVLCGAGRCLPDRTLGPAAQILRWYATMSGADSNYGFFAPRVGAPHRVRFLLQDHEGSTWSGVFDQTNSPEARLRLTEIVDYAFMAGTAEESPDWRKHLVRSWAAAMFTRHPTAVSLTVIVEAYDVPTMADFRAGSRPSWQMVYQAQVQRHSPPVQARSEQ